MGAFPVLSSGATVLYPLEVAHVAPARVLEFGDGSEHRFRLRPRARRFRISLRGVSAADADAVRTFFEAAKGRFDTTWSLTIGPETYSGLAFVSDEFSATETAPGRWDIMLEVEQVRH